MNLARWELAASPCSESVARLLPGRNTHTHTQTHILQAQPAFACAYISTHSAHKHESDKYTDQ